MSNQKIPFGRGESGTLDDLEAPKKKHYIENFSKAINTKKEGGINKTNTIGREKLINDDLQRIKNGEAEIVPKKQTTEFHIGSGKNKRIYGVGSSGKVFPKEGKGLFPLSRKEIKSLMAAKEKANELAENGHSQMKIFNGIKNDIKTNYPNLNIEVAKEMAEYSHKANKNKNNTQLQEVKGENKGQNHNSKNEVGNQGKGNNSNSLNSSSSSSQTNDYSATQVNGKKQTSTNSEQNISNKGGQKVQNTSKPTTSAKSSTSQKDKDTNKLTPTKKTPSKPKSPPARGPSH